MQKQNSSGSDSARAKQPWTTNDIAQAGLIAALYAAFTLVTIAFLGGLAFGPVQLRISEVICVFALFTRSAIPGLTIGCVLANLIGMAMTGTGVLGLLDVVFGSLATLLGALWMWHFRERRALALAGPVLANAIIVPAYLPIILGAFGFYTIPFTNIDLGWSYPLMYLFGLVSTGIGEAVVMYVLGLPLSKALKHTKLFARQSI
jgi:uncharacterized membrane protein